MDENDGGAARLSRGDAFRKGASVGTDDTITRYT